MGTYRIYRKHGSNRLAGEPPLELNLGSDQGAILRARQLLPTEAAEIWQSARFVGCLDRISGGSDLPDPAFPEPDNIWKSAFRRS